MKLHTFVVPDSADGSRLFALTKRMLPQLPEYRLREAFGKRDVKQNGTRVNKDATAIGGATVQIYLSEDSKLLIPEIVYEDTNILLIRKPVGISCEADAKGGLTVGEWLWQTTGDRLTQAPMPCHRLDNQTDGLLLLAKDEQTLCELEAAFRERRVHKRYVCLVKGTPKPPEALLTAYLRKDADAARVTVLDHHEPGALTIRTGYRVLEGGDVARLRIDLQTGRTHQIRAHMAHIGHPVLGDDVYGDRAFNRERKARRLMLTSTELHFDLTGRLAYLNEHSFELTPRF